MFKLYLKIKAYIFQLATEFYKYKNKIFVIKPCCLCGKKFVFDVSYISNDVTPNQIVYCCKECDKKHQKYVLGNNFNSSLY